MNTSEAISKDAELVLLQWRDINRLIFIEMTFDCSLNPRGSWKANRSCSKLGLLFWLKEKSYNSLFTKCPSLAPISFLKLACFVFNIRDRPIFYFILKKIQINAVFRAERKMTFLWVTNNSNHSPVIVLASKIITFLSTLTQTNLPQMTI